MSGSSFIRVLWTTAFTLVAGENIYIDELAFYPHELSAARIAAHWDAGQNRAFDSEYPGERVNNVLAAIGSSAPRAISTGIHRVAAVYMNGQTALDEMRSARTGENVDSILFINRYGAVGFLPADYRASSPYNTAQATFDDDGTDFAYHDLNVDYSDAFLWNVWNVTGFLGLTQTATDATSVTTYGEISESITDLQVSDADAASIAAALLAKYKDPMFRITSIAPKIATPDVAANAFARDLGDCIRVFRTPPGGGARIDQTLFLQSIRIDGSSDSPLWRVSWGVSPL
jgi:hypothetical protein